MTLTKDDVIVGMLGAANLSVEAAAKLIDLMTQAAHFLVPLGQVAVAVATVYYILRKAKAIKVPKQKKNEQAEDIGRAAGD